MSAWKRAFTFTRGVNVSSSASRKILMTSGQWVICSLCKSRFHEQWRWAELCRCTRKITAAGEQVKRERGVCHVRLGSNKFHSHSCRHVLSLVTCFSVQSWRGKKSAGGEDGGGEEKRTVAAKARHFIATKYQREKSNQTWGWWWEPVRASAHCISGRVTVNPVDMKKHPTRVKCDTCRAYKLHQWSATGQREGEREREREGGKERRKEREQSSALSDSDVTDLPQFIASLTVYPSELVFCSLFSLHSVQHHRLYYLHHSVTWVSLSSFISSLSLARVYFFSLSAPIDPGESDPENRPE